MAAGDIVISNLPELLEGSIEDGDLLHIVHAGINHNVTFGSLREAVGASFYTDRPLGEMSLITVAPTQTFDGSVFTKVESFDKIQYQRNIDVDIDTDTVTIEQDGNYRVTTDINAEFPNNQGAEFAIMVDGVVAETLGTLQGRGVGKPVFISAGDIDPYVIGQEITLGAKDDEDGSIDIIFHKVRITVEKV